jgi:hypothetical protein
MASGMPERTRRMALGDGGTLGAQLRLVPDTGHLLPLAHCAAVPSDLLGRS